MAQEELKSFLINLKLIYQHGVSHSKNKSNIHRLFAIHECHYVVEQIIREQAKNMTFKDALTKIGFEDILKRVNKKKTIPDYNRLSDFNKIRNNAEHLNVIPDIDNVRFYTKIVGDFLKWSYKEYYGLDYESLALEDMILDVPIRNRLIDAKSLIEKNDLVNASKKMYEGVGAFKFMSFGFLSDPRVIDVSFGKTNLPNLLADLAFKIIMADDEPALRIIMQIKTEFQVDEKGNLKTQSVYPVPLFKDKEEANQHYEDILNIILTYQDRIPSSMWRNKE
jgi:hypothetical protein